VKLEEAANEFVGSTKIHAIIVYKFGINKSILF